MLKIYIQMYWKVAPGGHEMGIEYPRYKEDISHVFTPHF